MISQSTKEEFNKKLNEKFAEVKKNIKKPNVLIVGGTGVGKSSIVNLIFGKDTVKVGHGKPVTQGINKIDVKEKKIVLFDTEGFEIGEDSEGKFRKEIVGEVNKRKENSLDDQIHLIWQVIDASTNRVTDYDIKLYNDLVKTSIPVALIFSKADLTNEEDLTPMVKSILPNLLFQEAITNDNSPFFTSNDKETIKLHSNLHIEKVINWSIESLPEVLRDGFIGAQIGNLDAKRKKANSIITQHSLGNALVGGSPIPFSDAPILILSQAGMLARIINIYDLGSTGDSVKDFMKGQGTQLVVSNLGKSLAGNLLKLIPGIGTVIGGLINGAVASAITFAMGKATSEYLYDVAVKIAAGKDVSNLIDGFEAVFEDLFNKNFKGKK